MMKTFLYPDKSKWLDLAKRTSPKNNSIDQTVQKIMEKVRKKGDKALLRYAKDFDKVLLNSLSVSREEINSAIEEVSPSLKSAIQAAYQNISLFHQEQLTGQKITETLPGIQCWRKSVPISHVGLYIPGGSAPLFSTVLMLGIPARLAGCGSIILCTPPRKDGRIDPAILYTANLCGITRIFKAGGAQAIAAMAYGTESIPKVFKIFGPGNSYVTRAKQLAQLGGIAIDMPAGPSELLVIADETADPEFIAADLLSQAEHGPESQVILVTTRKEIPEKVKASLSRLLEEIPRKKLARRALKNSRMILLKDTAEALAFSNDYAPEHLILSCKNAEALSSGVRNAGSVFIGPFAPESVGDYASGTNHTLPTNGYAAMYSGVSVDSFMKTISFQELSYEGLEKIGPVVMTMAEAEGLAAHRLAVAIRLKSRS